MKRLRVTRTNSKLERAKKEYVKTLNTAIKVKKINRDPKLNKKLDKYLKKARPTKFKIVKKDVVRYTTIAKRHATKPIKRVAGELKSRAINNGRPEEEDLNKFIDKSSSTATRTATKIKRKGTASIKKRITGDIYRSKIKKTEIKMVKKSPNLKKKQKRRTVRVLKGKPPQNRAVRTVNGLVKATKNAIRGLKAAYVASKGIIMLVAAGGLPAIMIILGAILLFAIVVSPFAIFFGGDDDKEEVTLEIIKQEVADEMNNRISKIKEANPNDEVVIDGSSSQWQQVLTFYAVYQNMGVSDDTYEQVDNGTTVNVKSENERNPENGETDEVFTWNRAKADQFKQLYWTMTTINSHIEEKEETTEVTTDDGHGNAVSSGETQVSKHRILYIDISGTTALQMADKYKMDDERKDIIKDMLSDDFSEEWKELLGEDVGDFTSTSTGVIGIGDSSIANVGLSQIGNAGGTKFWRYMGFSSRVEWCDCFVSWCANQCGYIEAGIIPKSASCITSANWFKSRNQWQSRGYTPKTGDIIFFDFYNQGETHHIGIVTYVENGTIHTIEGNSNDVVKERTYSVSYDKIYGYGIPNYG